MTVRMKFQFVIVLLSLITMYSEAAEAQQVIGHRGNALFAPENTVASFSSALGKADLVEFDVYRSSDGQLVVIHDPTLDRTTDGSGLVSLKSLEDLKKLDAGSWFHPYFTGESIPTMSEAIQAIIPAATPLIERKGGDAADYVALLQSLGVTGKVVVQAFNWDFLADVHALNPEIELAALGQGDLTSSKIESMKETGAKTVAWEKSDVGAEEIEQVHAAGMGIYIWTADGSEIQRFLDLGVDGVITNDPGLAADLILSETPAGTSLSDEMMAYWKFDDGLVDSSSEVALDSAGDSQGALDGYSGQSGWLSGDEAYLQGSLSLDGIDDRILIPATEALDPGTNAVTISVWINLAGLPSNLTESYGGIYDSREDCYVLYMDKSAREIRFKVTDQGGHTARPGIPESKLNLGNWHHLAAVYDGNAGDVVGQARIYLDGILQDVHTGSDGMATGLTGWVKSGQQAAVGSAGVDQNSFFEGAVDDLAIWRRALNGSEITRIVESGQNGQALDTLYSQSYPVVFWSVY